jgi:hypothetical protein
MASTNDLYAHEHVRTRTISNPNYFGDTYTFAQICCLPHLWDYDCSPDYRIDRLYHYNSVSNMTANFRQELTNHAKASLRTI